METVGFVCSTNWISHILFRGISWLRRVTTTLIRDENLDVYFYSSQNVSLNKWPSLCRTKTQAAMEQESTSSQRDIWNSLKSVALRSPWLRALRVDSPSRYTLRDKLQGLVSAAQLMSQDFDISLFLSFVPFSFRSFSWHIHLTLKQISVSLY